MSTSKAGSGSVRRPTPDDLAGTPACRDEKDHPIQKHGLRRTRGRGRGKKKLRPAETAAASAAAPTADDLAGIPVSVEGKEDVTVRTRKAGRS